MCIGRFGLTVILSNTAIHYNTGTTIIPVTKHVVTWSGSTAPHPATKFVTFSAISPAQLLINHPKEPSTRLVFHYVSLTMSFLKALPRNSLPLARTRLFSTSPYARKSTIDAAKEAAKTLDRTIADAAVKGIEKGGTL